MWRSIATLCPGTSAITIRYNAAASRLQIDADGNGTVDRQVDLTGLGVNFDAATDLILV